MVTKHRRNTIKGYSLYIVTSKMYSSEVVCIHKHCGNVHELRTCIHVCSFGVYKTAACTTCMQMYFHVHKKKMQTNFQFFKAWWICTIHPLWLFHQQCNAWCIKKKKQFFAKGLIVIPVKRKNTWVVWALPLIIY